MDANLQLWRPLVGTFPPRGVFWFDVSERSGSTVACGSPAWRKSATGGSQKD